MTADIFYRHLCIGKLQSTFTPEYLSLSFGGSQNKNGIAKTQMSPPAMLFLSPCQFHIRHNQRQMAIMVQHHYRHLSDLITIALRQNHFPGFRAIYWKTPPEACSNGTSDLFSHPYSIASAFLLALNIDFIMLIFAIS